MSDQRNGPSNPQPMPSSPQSPPATKFCQHCGECIACDAVLCTKCGRQVAQLNAQQAPPNIIITNTTTTIPMFGQAKNKWLALLLCFFFGVLGVHKFYEDNVFIGILYLCTGGLCGIGVLIDLVSLLLKPNPYYV